MDVLSTDDWLQELGMEDSNLNRECQMGSGDHFLDYLNCVSPENYPSSYIEELRADSGNSVVGSEVTDFPKSDGSTPSTTRTNENPNKKRGVVNEEMMNLSSLSSQSSEDNMNDMSESCERKNKRVCAATSRAPLQARNHILAERKRRERLNQRLISLSALIPGLKRMDKASILEDAIKYIKQLKESVQTLENENKKKSMDPTTTSTAFSLKRSRSCVRGGGGSDKNKSKSTGGVDGTGGEEQDNGSRNFKQLFPEIEIEARVSDTNVLVRIHCKKQGRAFLVTKVLSELPAFHLDVVSSVTLPFGNAALDITIIAQMDDEFRMTAKELVKSLRLAVEKFM